MSKGYWIVFCGVALFAAVISLGPALHMTGLAAGTLAGLAVLALMLGFVLGTLYIGVEKGYSISLTLLLGLIPLVGLIVLAVLPYRRSRF